MPTLFTHALTAGVLGQLGAQEWRNQPRFWAAVVFCAALPDVDVVGFVAGVRYGDLWGHRGMTHSLLFAAAVAILLAFALGRAMRPRAKLALLFFVAGASHGVLDALTDGGLGVAFFSPFDTARYFFPWQPIHVSPIGIARFFSARGIEVLQSEVVWVWTPSLILAFLIIGLRRYRVSRKTK